MQLLEGTIEAKYTHCEDAIEHGVAQTVGGGALELGAETASFPEQAGVRDGAASQVLYDQIESVSKARLSLPSGSAADGSAGIAHD